MTLDYVVATGRSWCTRSRGQHPLVACAHQDVTGTELGDSLLFERPRPHALAFWTGTRPRVVGVSPSIVPFVYFKRAAAARSPRSRDGRSNVPAFEFKSTRRGVSDPDP